MAEKNYLTPAEIIKIASKNMALLPNQAKFREDLATIFSMHLAKVKAMEEQGLAYYQLPSTSAFIVSPTGTGKSYILKQIAKASGMNIDFINSTQLSPAGFKGMNVDDALKTILAKNSNFFEDANIIVFDEFDKTFNKHPRADEFMFKVQADTLKLFEGGEYSVNSSLGGSRTISLDKTLIILAGACSGILPLLREKYIPKKSTGFNINSDEDETSDNKALLRKITINDLVDYGLMREMASRINTVLQIDELQKEDYLALVESKSKVSAYSQFNNIFKTQGCKLSIS